MYKHMVTTKETHERFNTASDGPDFKRNNYQECEFARIPVTFQAKKKKSILPN